jgi:U3 small nucleolar RNA-associated protein 12
MIDFTGHEMSVTALAVDPQKRHLASGGRDYMTRVWDIETQKTLYKRKISRNVITGIRWLESMPDLLIETSEDLYLRVFDIREKPFKPV